MTGKMLAISAALCFAELAFAQEPKATDTSPVPSTQGEGRPAEQPKPLLETTRPPVPTEQPKPPVETTKPPAAPAQAAPALKFEMHGFASGSVYVQDANLGPSEGQLALYVNAQTAAARKPTTDKLMLSGDVRQSRFNFSLAAPGALGGKTPKAVVEIDFFGGFGLGNFGDVNLLPRLRQTYAELSWGTTRLQVGQANDLIFAIAPVSLSHIAYPIGYASGNIGWRRPGVFAFHTVGGAGPEATRLELAAEVGRGNWADAPLGGAGGATVVPSNGTTAGGDAYGFNEAASSGLPAVEMRLTGSMGTRFTGFVAGHFHRVDRSGLGAPSPSAIGIVNLDVIAATAGGKLVLGPLTLATSGFVGKNLAPLNGQFIQFQPNAVNDVHELGGWVQAGFNFTSEVSLWGYMGIDKPSFDDAKAAGFTKVRNVTSGSMLQYRKAGYAVGLEWLHFHTDTRVPATASAPDLSGTLDGNQWIGSVNYFF